VRTLIALLAAPLLIACPGDPPPPPPPPPEPVADADVEPPPAPPKPVVENNVGPRPPTDPVVDDEEDEAEPVEDFATVLAEANDLLQRNDLDGAEKVWSAFVMAAPSHKRANFELGRVLYRKGDLQGSKKQAEIACFQGWEDGCVQAELIKKEIETGKKP
jgi:TolA-binding protein